MAEKKKKNEEVVKQSFWQKHRYNLGRIAVEFIIGGTLVMIWFIAGSAYYSVRNRVSVQEYNVLAEKLFKTQSRLSEMKKKCLAMCKKTVKVSKKNKRIKKEKEKRKYSKLSIAKKLTAALPTKQFAKKSNSASQKNVKNEEGNENHYWTCENDKVSETNLKNDGTFRGKPLKMKNTSNVGCMSYPHDDAVYDLGVRDCRNNSDIVLSGKLNLCTQRNWLLMKNVIGGHSHFTRSRFLKPAFDKFMIMENCSRIRLNKSRTGLIYMCMPGCVKTGRWGVCKHIQNIKKQKSVDDFEL